MLREAFLKVPAIWYYLLFGKAFRDKRTSLRKASDYACRNSDHDTMARGQLCCASVEKRCDVVPHMSQRYSFAIFILVQYKLLTLCQNINTKLGGRTVREVNAVMSQERRR